MRRWQRAEEMEVTDTGSILKQFGVAGRREMESE